jgi:hypothetical protein
MLSRNAPPRRLYAWDLAHRIAQGSERPLVVSADAPLPAGRLSIEGAVSFPQFESMRESIPKDRVIVLFSSSLEDTTAIARAAELEDLGYSRVSILEGGILAWDSIIPFLSANRPAD